MLERTKGNIIGFLMGVLVIVVSLTAINFVKENKSKNEDKEDIKTEEKNKYLSTEEKIEFFNSYINLMHYKSGKLKIFEGGLNETKYIKLGECEKVYYLYSPEEKSIIKNNFEIEKYYKYSVDDEKCEEISFPYFRAKYFLKDTLLSFFPFFSNETGSELKYNDLIISKERDIYTIKFFSLPNVLIKVDQMGSLEISTDSYLLNLTPNEDEMLDNIFEQEIMGKEGNKIKPNDIIKIIDKKTPEDN